MAWKDMEKKRAGQKAWYEKNKEIINAKKREYYHLTKPPPKPEKPKKTDEEIRARQKAYYQKNKEKINLISKCLCQLFLIKCPKTLK